MKGLLIISALVTCVLGGSLSKFSHRGFLQSPRSNEKIVGGTDVELGEIPYQASLFYEGMFWCAGSIISANFILTAAHCTDGTLASGHKAYYGSVHFYSGLSTDIEYIIINTRFSEAKLDNDVSVMKTVAPISFTPEVQPAVLRGLEVTDGEKAVASGFGVTEEGSITPSNILQKVTIKVVPRDSCNASYVEEGIVVTERMICAAAENKDSCTGDSGGPLTIRNQLVGIVSFGLGCARPKYPGVYSNVAALKDFIDMASNNEATWV